MGQPALFSPAATALPDRATHETVTSALALARLVEYTSLLVMIGISDAGIFKPNSRHAFANHTFDYSASRGIIRPIFDFIASMPLF